MCRLHSMYGHNFSLLLDYSAALGTNAKCSLLLPIFRGLSVSVLDTMVMSLGKTAKPIEVPCILWGPKSPMRMGNFEGLLAVLVLCPVTCSNGALSCLVYERSMHCGDVALRQITLTTCYYRESTADRDA